MSRKNKKRDSAEAPRKSEYKVFWPMFVLFWIWYVIGFPFSFVNPQLVEVKAAVSETAYGNSPRSWREDIAPEMTTNLIQWGRDNGLHPDTLSGAVKAASLERNLSTGKPKMGTGYRVSMFDILGITSIETVLGQNEVDPTAPNPTGGCIAWWELIKHELLDGVRETSDLKKTVEPLGFKVMEIYGSCGAGAIGWTQALPSNWWSLMGPGFDPWLLEDSAEFTARYLTVHRYFSSGRRSAVLSYNPGAGDSYVNPVIAKADSLRASFEASGISIPKTVVTVTTEEEEDASLEEPGTEDLELEAQVERPTEDVSITLTVFPIDGPRGSWAFGEKTWYQDVHSGEDIMCPIGTSVKSPGPGIVESTDWYPTSYEIWGTGHGKTIWVFHGYNAQGEAVRSLTGHLSEYVAKEGDWVEAGQLIAYSGDTGAGSGPHGHIAIRVGGGCFQCEDQFDGRWEDPDDWIGTGKVIYAEFPSDLDLSSSLSNGSRTADARITLTLRKTPILTSTLWLGGKTQDIDEAIGHLGTIQDLIKKANNVAGFVLEADEEIKALDSFLESVGVNISAEEFFKTIQEADELLERVGSIVDFLIKAQTSMLKLHRTLSVWSIGGQPRELGIDPSLNWRLYPIDN